MIAAVASVVALATAPTPGIEFIEPVDVALVAAPDSDCGIPACNGLNKLVTALNALAANPFNAAAAASAAASALAASADPKTRGVTKTRCRLILYYPLLGRRI